MNKKVKQMYEWITGEYRFTGYSEGMVMVYREKMHIDSFNVSQGIQSKDTLIHEAKQYLKFTKQKY
jgi:hypothetical protein